MRLVLDWDGTVTETDSLWMALEEFGDPEVFARVEGSLVDGRLSFQDVMELEFATVTAPVADSGAAASKSPAPQPACLTCSYPTFNTQFNRCCSPGQEACPIIAQDSR